MRATGKTSADRIRVEARTQDVETSLRSFPTAAALPLAALPLLLKRLRLHTVIKTSPSVMAKLSWTAEDFLLSMIRDISVKTETPVGGLPCLAFGAVLLIPALMRIQEPRDGPFYIAIFTVVGMIFLLCTMSSMFHQIHTWRSHCGTAQVLFFMPAIRAT